MVVFEWVILTREGSSNYACLSLSNPQSALREDPFGRTSAPSLYHMWCFVSFPPSLAHSPHPTPHPQPHSLFMWAGKPTAPSGLGTGRRLAIMPAEGMYPNCSLSEIPFLRTPSPSLPRRAGASLHQWKIAMDPWLSTERCRVYFLFSP